MKLKEYPGSIYRQIKLRSLKASAFQIPLTQGNVIPAIISLTTIPSRLPIVDITIRSLLLQSINAEKIVLWLNTDLKNQIPHRLSELIGSRFDIQYRKGTSSHRKLVFALVEYPNHVVITADDDLMYPTNWLDRLWQDHLTYPNDIVGHECRTITYYSNGKVQPYREWKTCKPGESTRNTLAIGYGGTLYPANALHVDTVNEEQYLKLAPKADDLWFKAMALRNHTNVRRSNHPKPRPIPIAGSQKFALGHTNIRADGNKIQWQALCDFYSFN